MVLSGWSSDVELPKRQNSPAKKPKDTFGRTKLISWLDLQLSSIVHQKDANPKRKPTGSPFTFWIGGFAEQVKTGDLSPDDIIIAVVGPTGSGKSTFINTITGLETDVGHNLKPCTSKINNVRLSLPGLAYGDLVYVDAPGFDNAEKSDTKILQMVHDWLKTTYGKDTKLSGLLYFHRISDNRTAGSPLKNLRMFEELCGKNTYQNIILTTTMWDQVTEEEGEEREKEVKSTYWKTMLDRSSTTSRFMGTRESALTVIDPLIDAAIERSSALLQKKLVDMGKKLPSTSAGRKLVSEMEVLVGKRQDLLRRMRTEINRTDGDNTTLEALQEEYQRLQNSLEAIVNEMRRLRLPLGHRLLSITDKSFSSSKSAFRFFR